MLSPYITVIACKTTTATCEPVEMKLAERGVYLGKARFLVKEVRKLTESGHQTAIICTAKRLEAAQIALGMFARWSQENFFAYAMHHFNPNYAIEFLKKYF